jgi:hypothetical protein
MKGLKLLLTIFVFTLLTGSIKVANAQCAQCAATVETNNKSGAGTTRGLNNGILFLLAAPYLAVGIAGYVWYRKYRRKNVNLLKMRSEKLNLN